MNRRALPALGLVVVVSMLLLHHVPSIRAESDPGLYRIGIMRSVFRHRNENDMLAAMKVWTNTIASERGVRIESDLQIFESVNEAARAVRTDAVDALTLELTEYSAFPEGLLGGPFIRSEVGGTTHAQFVLVSRADGGVGTPEGLRDASLVVRDSQYDPLKTLWLDARLAGSGLGPSTSIVASLERNIKVSTTVLSVFFGTSDACLVTRAELESMAELNPQVSAQLSVVAESPPVLPSIFCFRRGLDEAHRARLAEQIMRLDETVTGEQVLQVFRADRMAEVTAGELERSLGLLRDWRLAGSGQERRPGEDRGGRR